MPAEAFACQVPPMATGPSDMSVPLQ